MATFGLTPCNRPPNVRLVIRLARAADAPAIHAIYAPIVRDTPISFEWEVPSVGEMARRMAKVLETRPWLVYEEAGEVIGYVYASTFRDRIAYQWGTEVTVYLHEAARGRGLAPRLYAALFDVLRLQGYCTAVAGATMPNPASERLHLKLGFTEFGRYPAAGFKFGEWYDVVFWYLRLRPLPERPPELRSIHEIIGTREFNDAIKK
jgi:L-amino acid N-acyltransferase YncA